MQCAATHRITVPSKAASVKVTETPAAHYSIPREKGAGF